MTTLKYAYYALATVVIVLLLFAAGFEFHIRHTKKTLAASGLVFMMFALFWISNSYLFPMPKVPDASMTAAAASMLKK